MSAAHLVLAPEEGNEERLGVEIERVRTEVAGLCEVHGVELVALEWLQGPGRGVLRVYIDRPNGDPRVVDPARGITADLCVAVSRDVGAALDADESLVTGAYDLEVSSPGFERPVQKREDFDRFAGLEVHVKLRERVGSRSAFDGVLRGTADAPEGTPGYLVKVEAGGKVWELPSKKITRAKLAEIKAPKPTKPGKGPSKRSKQRPDDARSDATEGDDEGSSPAR